MRPCRNDTLMKLLNQEGYQPVLGPRTNVVPPEVYNSNGKRLVRRGPLADYMRGTALPDLRSGQRENIQQTVTSGKTTSAAASFLADALRCIGVDGAPKLDLSFAHDRTLAFNFTGVTYLSLDPSQIDQLMPGFDPGAIPAEVIEDGDLFIAYEYAYAETLLMRDTSATSGNASFEALKIEQFIDVGAKARMHVESDTTLSFKAASGGPIAFACKLGRLERRETAWRFFPEEAMGPGLAPNEAGIRPFLVERGAILQVEDAAG